MTNWLNVEGAFPPKNNHTVAAAAVDGVMIRRKLWLAVEWLNKKVMESRSLVVFEMPRIFPPLVDSKTNKNGHGQIKLSFQSDL